MKTLGRLARQRLTAVCILLALATPIYAQTVRPTGAREKELFEAIKQRDSARVEALLAAGVSANARSIINYESWESSRPTCATALKNALHRNPEVVRALLDAGADARVRGKDGRNALKLAGESGNRILIGMLKGAARR